MKITTREEFQQFKSTFSDKIISSREIDGGIEITTKNQTIWLPINCKKWVSENHVVQSDEYANDLIFGKDKTRNVVSIEVKDSEVYVYTEKAGKIELSRKPFKYWIMSDRQPQGIYTRMDGNLHFKYLKEFDTEKEFKEANQKLYAIKADKYVCYDAREAYMVRHGLTYFKGMKVEDVSVLSFDLETEGVNAENDRVLLISNTVRKAGQVIKKLFSLDEYKNELSMIQDWAKWVRDTDPSVMIGHNVYAFDFPFLVKRVEKCQKTQVGIEKDRGLRLGRDESTIKIATKPSQFRKDGSQSYDYFKINIFGREIVDTFFLSMKYDIQRQFISYGLKSIIEQLGMEKEGRIKWDFSENKPKNFFGKDKELTQKFKEYCIDDSDDSLKLFDLMIPAFFYLTVKVPKTFQNIIESASGAQINLMFCRRYISADYSIPKPTESQPFEGAISFGIPGIYPEGFSVDFAGLYPSIIREYQIYDHIKDPLKYQLELVEFIAVERLKHKKIAKETGSKYYKDLEQSEKIVANSIYGFEGAEGLNFNSPKNAGLITEMGRKLLNAITTYTTGKDVYYWKGLIEKKD